MSDSEEQVLAVACTVRGCGEPLRVLADGGWGCATGHRFDRARAGYVNLLQPQDKRSSNPGDESETVAARARLAAGRVEDALHEAVSSWASSSMAGPGEREPDDPRPGSPKLG